MKFRFYSVHGAPFPKTILDVVKVDVEKPINTEIVELTTDQFANIVLSGNGQFGVMNYKTDDGAKIIFWTPHNSFGQR